MQVGTSSSPVKDDYGIDSLRKIEKAHHINSLHRINTC